MSLEGSLALVVARLARHVEVSLSASELSLSQYRLLAHLAGGSEASSKLAAKLAVSPPSVTAIIDGLVVRGFVARTSDEADRRRVVPVITAKGRRVLRQADTAASARLAEVVSLLDEPRRVRRAMQGLEDWGRATDMCGSVRSTPAVIARK